MIPGLGTKSHMLSGAANIYIHTFFGWVTIYICLERKPDKYNYLSSPNSSTKAHGRDFGKKNKASWEAEHDCVWGSSSPATSHHCGTVLSQPQYSDDGISQTTLDSIKFFLSIFI